MPKTNCRQQSIFLQKELGTVLTKVKLMDQLYRSYLNKAENIYYLTDKDNLTYSQIDTLYNQLRKLRKTLLENTGDLEDYQKRREPIYRS